jgi:urease accessory protein
MLTITERLHDSQPAVDRLVLPFELRQKSRIRCRLGSGQEAGVVLDRGTLLRGGDLLRATDGRVIEVIAAPETVTVVRTNNPWQLARAAYHLGNRHVPVQLGKGWLRYVHDHVLDDMLHGLGFELDVEVLPFEPEGGAYSHYGPAHAGHGHEHEQHDHA